MSESTSERDRVSGLSSWYVEEQLDIDKKMTAFIYETIRPALRGRKGLELGVGDGTMTRLLKSDFASLTVVDAAADLLENARHELGVETVCALFEEFRPSQRFDTILMSHILEHVDDPPSLIAGAKSWLNPGGRIIVIVPNGRSFHRLAAVKMGLLSHPCELKERDYALGHRRVYKAHELDADLKAGGLRVVERGGVFFKPLTNGQMQASWTDQMIRGFYELGKDFPDHAAELYAVCEAA
jgi:2-polyprenyl-3-methyl-5-hydroxy-6-metoxy-1,4-benzoquinol methylase